MVCREGKSLRRVKWLLNDAVLEQATGVMRTEQGTAEDDNQWRWISAT